MNNKQTAISLDSLADQPLPVPAKHLSSLLVFFQEDEFNLAAISEMISRDVALALAILGHVNRVKARSGKDYVVNIESAVNLIGFNKVKEIIGQLPVLEKEITNTEQLDDYYSLMQIIQHATFHAYQWAVARKDNSPKEVHMATLLSLVTQCYLCLYHYPLYRQIRQRFEQGNESFHGAANQVLGFNIADFSMSFCKKLYLPGLVIDSLDPKMHEFYRPMGVMIAVEVAMQASLGWYHKGMLQTMEVASDYLASSFDYTVRLIHQKAVEYTRYEYNKRVLPVAAGLITLRTGELAQADSQQQEAPRVEKNFVKIAAAINSAMNRDTKTAVEALRFAVKQIFQQLEMERVVLALISKKDAKLRFNIVLGEDKDSDFAHYQTPLNTRTLFSLLVKKPQSAHLAGKLYTQYSTLIPGDFKALSQSQEFLLMSLFNGNKALGMMWADNHGKTIKKQQFVAFKLVVGNLNKHINHLAQQARKAG